MPDTWDSLPQKDRDALVATKVMGAKGERWLAWEFPDGSFIAKRFYHPTEDIAQAWEVLDKHGWHYDISSSEIADGVRSVRVYLDIGDDDFCVHAPTAADAICHAAVLAVKGEDDASSS